MPKSIRIGKMSFDTKSVLFGAIVMSIGMCAPPTSSIFTKIYNSIAGIVRTVFKSK